MRRGLLIASLFASSAATAAPAAKAPAKAAEPAPAAGGPKAVTTKNLGACAVKVFPLVEGNEWTFSQVPPATPAPDALKRIIPPQPSTVVVTVKSVEAKKGADTVVTLTEKMTTDVSKDDKKPVVDERTIETTITCNGKTKFEISPESFLFAGDPGGYLGLKLDSFDRSHDVGWKLTNGGIGDATWREEAVAKWTRVPTPGSNAKLGSGKLELERTFTPQPPEMVYTKAGNYRSEKLALVTTGRVTLDAPAAPDAKPFELPAGWLTTLWFATGTGPVQILNAYSQEFQLVDAKLK